MTNMLGNLQRPIRGEEDKLEDYANYVQVIIKEKVQDEISYLREVIAVKGEYIGEDNVKLNKELTKAELTNNIIYKLMRKRPLVNYIELQKDLYNIEGKLRKANKILKVISGILLVSSILYIMKDLKVTSMELVISVLIVSLPSIYYKIIERLRTKALNKELKSYKSSKFIKETMNVQKEIIKQELDKHLG